MLAGGIYRWPFLRTRKMSAGSVQRPSVYLPRQFLRGPVPPGRLSSDTPISNAFWRVAPSVLLSFLAIWLALVFFRAILLSVRSCTEVHARRFFILLAIRLPIRMRFVNLSQGGGWLKVWVEEFHTKFAQHLWHMSSANAFRH